MAIRNEGDAMSRAGAQERDYFRKQDLTQTNLDFNRFFYMPIGSKDKFYDWRFDWDKKYIKSSKFLINAEKFVNRPDAIAYEVYGNSKYWWIIAMANDIKEPFYEFYKGRSLDIPDLDYFKKALGM